MWSPCVLTVNSGWKTILLEVSRIWWMVKISTLLAYFFDCHMILLVLYHVWTKKALIQRPEIQWLITSRCNEFICSSLYILMFVPTLLSWLIFNICAAERKSLMNAFKRRICQGQSFKSRSFYWNRHCILFLFNIWLDYQSKCWP